MAAASEYWGRTHEGPPATTESLAPATAYGVPSTSQDPTPPSVEFGMQENRQAMSQKAH